MSPEQSGVTSQEISGSHSDGKFQVERLLEEPESSSQTGQVILPSQKEKIVLAEGKTLRLLAEDLFGNREFWVYIYLENKDKIPNPNKVSSGTELVLPDKDTYFIDASDPQSVAKAKSLGEKMMGGS